MIQAAGGLPVWMYAVYRPRLCPQMPFEEASRV